MPSNQIAGFPATCLQDLSQYQVLVTFTHQWRWWNIFFELLNTKMILAIIDLHLHSTLNINSVQHGCMEISPRGGKSKQKKKNQMSLRLLSISEAVVELIQQFHCQHSSQQYHPKGCRHSLCPTWKGSPLGISRPSGETRENPRDSRIMFTGVPKWLACRARAPSSSSITGLLATWVRVTNLEFSRVC